MTSNEDILRQVQQEYQLGYDYVKSKRSQFRDRILKRGYQGKAKKTDKININMIANTIDTLIASFWVDGIKTKFISRDGWVGQEEADNTTNVFKFDNDEQNYQQLHYQSEQDSLFFGVGITNLVGFDKKKSVAKFRAINPLSWIPDPMPTRTGDFSAQNYRWHGFEMLTNVFDLKNKDGYNEVEISKWIKAQFDSESNLTRQTYADKNNLDYPATLQTVGTNFVLDVYHHYTIIDGQKYLVVTDANKNFLFKKEKLSAVLAEEKEDEENVPRPIALNYYDPERNNPFGKSLCDKLEDKQNAKSILFNLSVMKAKKETLGGTYLVNSRLIKNKSELNKPTTDTKYIFLNENISDETRLDNIMYEVQQAPSKSDSFNMIQSIEKEAREDSSVDSLQSGLAPDKTMTKAEAQQIQANANMKLALKNGIKSWYYKEFAFLRWRAYQEYFTLGQKKFIALNQNFEWRSITYTKDDLKSKSQPYIAVGTTNDIDAIDENMKGYMNSILPMILQDPETPKISKLFAKRITYRLNGMSENQINIMAPLSADERKAKDFLFIVNQGLMPKSLLSNSNIDLFTVYLYLQKAEDGEIKNKVIKIVEDMLLEQGVDAGKGNEGFNQMANASANIQMAQNAQSNQGEVLSRGNLQSNIQQ